MSSSARRLRRSQRYQPLSYTASATPALCNILMKYRKKYVFRSLPMVLPNTVLKNSQKHLLALVLTVRNTRFSYSSGFKKEHVKIEVIHFEQLLINMNNDHTIHKKFKKLHRMNVKKFGERFS